MDPLRAARVAIFGDRFHYFCSPACREHFTPVSRTPSERPGVLIDRPEPARERPERLSLESVPPVSALREVEHPRSERPRSVRVEAKSTKPEPAPARSVRAPAPRSERVAAPRSERVTQHPPAPEAESELAEPAWDDLGTDSPLSVRPESRALPAPVPNERALTPALQVSLAFGAGTVLADLTDLGLGAQTSYWLAPGLASVACCALCVAVLGQPGNEWRRPALLALLPPVLGTLAALAGLLGAQHDRPPTASVAGMICFVAALSNALGAHRRRALAPGNAELEMALSAPARKVVEGGGTEWVGQLRPGEEILLEPGERSPADALIVSGKARVEPWFGAEVRLVRQEGEVLLAGARATDARLRAVVRWAGVDRAWARLTLDPARRADRHAQSARLAERLAASGALLLGLGGALIALASHRGPALVLSSAAALGATLANIALPELVALHIARGVQRLLRRGIYFRSPAALDRAGRVSSVIFCAEGTLLRSELSVASIEPSPQLNTEELLGLLAGAYAGVPSPIAAAVQRSAQAHEVRPDATRSPIYTPGLGVTAVASSGQTLVVGTRTLLLEQRVSVAGAEARIAELEGLGRSVLLAALEGRWVGLLALQDSPAPGARAAVQGLLDSGVEPVLLSAETRETCRALARHIGVEHVRPEILPEQRADEVRRLAETRSGIAVVACGSTDDAALGSAPLSINLDARGGPVERWDVDIASGDVRDAAAAVQLAGELHLQTRRALQLALAPAALATALLFAGMPAWLVPLLGLGGTFLALRQLRLRSD